MAVAMIDVSLSLGELLIGPDHSRGLRDAALFFCMAIIEVTDSGRNFLKRCPSALVKSNEVLGKALVMKKAESTPSSGSNPERPHKAPACLYGTLRMKPGGLWAANRAAAKLIERLTVKERVISSRHADGGSCRSEAA